jgi:hypothetical protein
MTGLTLSGCGHCVSEPLKSYESQGDITLRLERNGCAGATSGFTYELRAYSVRRETKTLLLRFDNDHRYEWDGDPEKLLDVRWLSPYQARLRFHYPVRVFKERKNADDTEFSYGYARGTNLMTGWFGGSVIVE